MAEFKVNERRAHEIGQRLALAAPSPWREERSMEIATEPVIGGPPVPQVYWGPGVEFGNGEVAIVECRTTREFVTHSRRDVEDLLHDLALARRQRDALVEGMERIQTYLRHHSGGGQAHVLRDFIYAIAVETFTKAGVPASELSE